MTSKNTGPEEWISHLLLVKRLAGHTRAMLISIQLRCTIRRITESRSNKWGKKWGLGLRAQLRRERTSQACRLALKWKHIKGSTRQPSRLILIGMKDGLLLPFKTQRTCCMTCHLRGTNQWLISISRSLIIGSTRRWTQHMEPWGVGRSCVRRPRSTRRWEEEQMKQHWRKRRRVGIGATTKTHVTESSNDKEYDGSVY